MEPLAALADEMTDEFRDIVLPGPQRRHFDREDAQTIEEIETKPAVGDVLLQIPIGRSQHPDVHAPRRILADALELALLQDAQELRLQIRGNLADLVEEQRAAVGELEPPDPVAHGAGERSRGRGRRTRSRTAPGESIRSSP